MAAPETGHVELVCGCLVGEDGPVVLCPTAHRLGRHADYLLPPFGNDDADDWGVYHEALREYRTHVRTS